MMSDPQVILLGQTACLNQSRLGRLLTTTWRTAAVPDDSDPEAVGRSLPPDADALIGLFWRRGMAAPGTRLKLIQALGAGVDAYDLTALPRGCTLCNVYEHEVPVAEYVIGAMVALTKRFAFHDYQFGGWDGSGRRDGAPHEELAGKTVGLIGYGRIGQEVAKRAHAFGLKIHALKARPRLAAFGVGPDWLGGPSRLHELVGASDYLVVCCPLDERTRGLLDARALARMKPTAYLINVARARRWSKRRRCSRC